MIIWNLLTVVVSITICYIIKFHWSRRKLYAAANKIESLPSIATLPLVGNAHIFVGKVEDVFQKIDSVLKKVEMQPKKFWLGHILVVVLKNPVHLEKIMSSQKFACKHELYTFLEDYLGEGLVSASGLKPKYKLHRRIIQPLLDSNFVNSSLEVVQHRTNICMEKLNQHVDKGTFDVHIVTMKYFIDVISEIILGNHNINSQEEGFTEFSKASIDAYNIAFERMAKPWLHPDLIYNTLGYKTTSENMIQILKKSIHEAIIESCKRRKLHEINDHTTFVPIIDKLGKYIEENPGNINNEDFMNHLMTLYTAAYDTMTIVSSFGILCFGMYPEYQEKAAKEIQTLIGETPGPISLTDLNKLTYLDMCLKDIMRLFPIAPFILRRCFTDFQLDKWTIPKEAAIFISIYHVHRDKNFWKCPDHFYPDHFLTDEVKNRHIFAYLPFSAGPRGCIGKTLANFQLKFFFCHLLQKFEIAADGKVPDLDLKSDISLRPKQGYNCRLRKRVWN